MRHGLTNCSLNSQTGSRGPLKTCTQYSTKQLLQSVLPYLPRPRCEHVYTNHEAFLRARIPRGASSFVMCAREAIQRTYLFTKTSKRMSNQAVPKLELAGVKSSGLGPKLVARSQSPTTGSANFWQALAKEGV